MKKKLLALTWIAFFLMISFILGQITQAGMVPWYSSLKLSPLNPPPIAFPIVWSLLYILLALAGYTLFCSATRFSSSLKSAYILQMLLNWSWTPLFFTYHMIGLSLLALIIMDLLSFYIAFKSYAKSKIVSAIFIVYSLWIVFATYLTGYIWLYN